MRVAAVAIVRTIGGTMSSGYKTITPIQLANVLWALAEGQISPHAGRVYSAAFVLVAVREAAARTRRKRREKPREFSRYRQREVERLTALDAAAVRRALRELARAGLVTFTEGEIDIRREPLAGSESLLDELRGRRSERRPIPVPRAVLRFLPRERKPALAKVMVGYLARGLSITRRTGELSGKGTVKASWLADHLGLSRRAVKYAQGRLQAMGWITKDTLSRQRKLNRDGAYFAIDLEWTWQREKREETPSEAAPMPATPLTVVNRDKVTPEFALPPVENAPVFAPPLEDRKTSIERNQDTKTQAAEPFVAGVCIQEGEGTQAENLTATPSLSRIVAEDLRRFSRLESLYFEAIARGWVSGSEAMTLNFVAAAVRARDMGHEPARLFVSLVKRGLWHHITQAQEDYARRSLQRWREDDPDRFRVPPDRRRTATATREALAA